MPDINAISPNDLQTDSQEHFQPTQHFLSNNQIHDNQVNEISSSIAENIVPGPERPASPGEQMS